MAAAKKKKVVDASPTRVPDTFKVVLYYQIHSAPPKPSQNTSPSEKIWRCNYSPIGLDPLTAKPWAYAQKEVRLPFVPFSGLRLEAAGIEGVPIVAVRWRVDGLKDKSSGGDLSAGYFLCTYEDQYPTERITYEKLKEFAIRQGWTVSEFGLS